MSEEYKILDSHWFSNPTLAHPIHDKHEYVQIGVVAVETFTGEWRAYIGVSYVKSKRSDEQTIAAWGSALSAQEAHGFFPELDISQYRQS